MFSPLQFISATDSSNKNILESLDRKLANFYNSDKVNNYWKVADEINCSWHVKTHPYHMHLRSFIRGGDKVVELGCGSAHAFSNLQDSMIEYTGVDWSEKQIRVNSDKYPAANFFASSVYNTSLPSAYFDFAISLFTLEHLVYPHLYLSELCRLVKCGGMVGILCPNFRGNEGMNSFVYGSSSLELREKIKHGRFLDTLIHLYQREVSFPQIIRRKYSSLNRKEKFLIYPTPKCLEGQYYSDTDAVYFTDQLEIEELLISMNFQIKATPISVRSEEFKSSFCYIIAEKES